MFRAAVRTAAGESMSERMLYTRVDGTTWPTDVSVEWELRYAPGAANLLYVASIVSAYSYLTDPALTQKEAVTALKRARRAAAHAASVALAAADGNQGDETA